MATPSTMTRNIYLPLTDPERAGLIDAIAQYGIVECARRIGRDTETLRRGRTPGQGIRDTSRFAIVTFLASVQP